MASRNLAIDVPIKLPVSGHPLGKAVKVGSSRCSMQHALREMMRVRARLSRAYFLCLTPASLTGPRMSRLEDLPRRPSPVEPNWGPRVTGQFQALFSSSRSCHQFQYGPAEIVHGDQVRISPVGCKTSSQLAMHDYTLVYSPFELIIIPRCPRKQTLPTLSRSA